MKRKIVLLVTMLMIFTMTACGAKEESNSVETKAQEAIVESVDAIKEIVEATPVPSSEPTSTPEPTAEPAVTEAPVVEEDVFTLEDGMAKINRLLEAHTVLLEQNKMLEDHVQYDTEGLSSVCGDLTQFTTADGLPYQTTGAIYATAIVYYNEYVNNNGEYYDFATWLNDQSDNSTVISHVDGIDAENWNTTDILLCEAIGLIAYLKSCDTVTVGDLIETTGYTVSGVESAYLMNVYCNGESEFEAVFDADENLLNIWPIDKDWNKYLTSFPDGDRGAGCAE